MVNFVLCEFHFNWRSRRRRRERRRRMRRKKKQRMSLNSYCWWPYGGNPSTFARGYGLWEIRFKKYLLISEREGEGQKERERHQLVPRVYAFTDWFLHVPWLGIEPAPLAYQNNIGISEQRSNQLSCPARAGQYLLTLDGMGSTLREWYVRICVQKYLYSIAPWLVWLSGLSVSLWTERLTVQFPVRAHAWVAGQVPSRGRTWEATTHWCFPLFLPPLPSL